MQQKCRKHEDEKVKSYITSRGYKYLKLPNGRYICIAPGNSEAFGPVIISGENVTLSPKKYRRIEAIAGCSLLFATNNCWEFEENPRDYDHDDYYNKIYSHTELKLVDAGGNEVYLGQIGDVPEEITSTNIEGGVSFEVGYKLLELRPRYTDRHTWVRYYAAYDVYYQEGKDYVEVIEKRGKGYSTLSATTGAYRLYFTTGRRERIEPTAIITKTLKPSGQ